MCVKQSSKAAKVQAWQAQQDIAVQREALSAAEADRKVTQASAQQLAADQLAFNERQQAFAEETASKNAALAARPAPPAALATATQVTGGTVQAEGDDPVKKKNRAALRIDMAAPQSAGSTGLNIARG